MGGVGPSIPLLGTRSTWMGVARVELLSFYLLILKKNTISGEKNWKNNASTIYACLAILKLR